MCVPFSHSLFLRISPLSLPLTSPFLLPPPIPLLWWWVHLPTAMFHVLLLYWHHVLDPFNLHPFFPDKEPITQGHILMCIGFRAAFMLLFHLLDCKNNYFSPSWFLMRKDCFPGAISLEWFQDKKTCFDSVFCLYPSPPPPVLNIYLEAIKHTHTHTKWQYFSWCYLHF